MFRNTIQSNTAKEKLFYNSSDIGRKSKEKFMVFDYLSLKCAKMEHL